MVASLTRDVALLDVRMPGLDGLGLLRRLRAESSSVRVLLISGSDDSEIAHEAIGQNQRGKAYDAAARSQVKTAQTAEETYATDHNGTYTSNKSDLTAIEPTLGDTGTGASITTVTGNRTIGYTLTSTAASTGDAFTLKDASGTVTRTCAAGSGGGSPGGCSGTSW